MPTLKEMYDLAVEHLGEDSKSAQALKAQMEAFGSPMAAAAMVPHFKTTSGLTPKDEVANNIKADKVENILADIDAD